MTPGSVAQFSTLGKMAPLPTRRRDHTHACPFPAFPRGPWRPFAARGQPGATPRPAPPAGVWVSRAARPPDKADNMATSARTSS